MTAIENFFCKEDQEDLASAFKLEHKNFDKDLYLSKTLTSMQSLPLKERMHKTADVLHELIDLPFLKTIKYLKPIAPKLKGRFVAMVFPDYVEKYGMNDFEASMEALEYFTCFGSSEFAVRPFLIHDFDIAFPWFLKWAKSENAHVRRLASEGLRPRLPWSMKIPKLVDDPTPAFDVLRPLSNDKSLYVKKSVGNHINDISKDNPDTLFPFFKSLDVINNDTRWIIKHGLRSLIKEGHPKAFEHLGFTKNPNVEIENFKLSKRELLFGNDIGFEFTISSGSQKSQKIAIDYILYLMKKNGKQSEKVFKFREMDLAPNQTISLKGKRPFQPISTRKYYDGEHAIEIMINGKRFGKETFNLKI